MDLVESAVRLVEDVYIVSLIEQDDVIEAIVINVNETDGASAVEFPVQLDC